MQTEVEEAVTEDANLISSGAVLEQLANDYVSEEMSKRATDVLPVSYQPFTCVG